MKAARMFPNLEITCDRPKHKENQNLENRVSVSIKSNRSRHNFQSSQPHQPRQKARKSRKEIKLKTSVGRCENKNCVIPRRRSKTRKPEIIKETNFEHLYIQKKI